MAEQGTPAPALVSVGEFGARTSLSPRTVWRLVRSGELPSLRVGRRRLVPLVDGLTALYQLGSQAGSPERGSE